MLEGTERRARAFSQRHHDLLVGRGGAIAAGEYARYRSLAACIHFNLAARRERQRLDDAAARADVNQLAQKLLRPDGRRTTPVLKKKSGLDDGVSL